MKKSGFLIAFLSCALFASLSLNLFLGKNFFPKLVATRVVDGDTFDLNNGQRVRLAGLDAPETKECLGEEAKAKLEELILKKTVKLEKESVDNFGRLVAFVFLDHQSVNNVLVKEGLARAMTSTNRLYQKNLLDLEIEAKNKGLGLWGNSCPLPTPLPPDCLVKGNIHWKKKQKLYSLPGCYNYNKIVIDPKNGDRWFCSEEEAKNAGFSLSSDCPSSQ